MTRRAPRRTLLLLAVAPTLLGLTACGSQSIDVEDTASINRGAVLFLQRCSGCHTMDVVGAEGGAYEIHDRERVDGPNFNVRAEEKDDVLYAIRNGGYSGAIMPENIVVGQEAEDVAEFLAKYSGRATSVETGGSEK